MIDSPVGIKGQATSMSLGMSRDRIVVRSNIVIMSSLNRLLPKRVGNWVGINAARGLGIVWMGRRSKNGSFSTIRAVCATLVM